MLNEKDALGSYLCSPVRLEGTQRNLTIFEDPNFDKLEDNANDNEDQNFDGAVGCLFKKPVCVEAR